MTADATAMPGAVPGSFFTDVATIMVKELRSRMRGRRAFVVLTAYLGVLALIAYGTYVVVGPAAEATAALDEFGRGGVIGQANASGLIGQSIFTVLSVFQVILVSFIAPAFTAGQISLEREKQTLDLLVTTPLRPSAIVVGKLLTALAFVVLMIVAALPISAIVLMYGGASVDDLLRQMAVLLSMAVAFGAIGIFASALLRRTQTATVVTYSAVLALTLGTAMTYAFWTQVANANDARFPFTRERAPEALRYLNPMVAILDIVSGVEATGPTRFTSALYQLFGDDLAQGTIAVQPCDLNVGCEEQPAGNFGALNPTSGYWWPRISISLLLLAGTLTLAASWLVVPPGMRGVRRRRRPVALDAEWPMENLETVDIPSETDR
ncbi:MAG TPA: ABC transporter permease subunit [Candidatus Limnocylindria bacterium]|nr:ABC transporter permease subunit [Candidatus Limnocylindria bacterium]